MDAEVVMADQSEDVLASARPNAVVYRDRIEALRAAMRTARWDGVIIPTGDPHVSEYPPAHWRSRAWLSGFNGSAGTLVVLQDKAALWTDGRYYIQATQQLEGSGIGLQRASERGCPKPEAWLCEQLPTGTTVACDGRQLPVESAARMRKALAERGIELAVETDPLATLWPDRPPLPTGPAFVHDARFAGLSARDKLNLVRGDMAEQKATHYLVSSLDAVAWLLNIRGSDIPWTPLALAYVLVGPDRATCFIEAAKCPVSVSEHLEKAGVARACYGDIRTALAGLDPQAVLLLDPKRTCAALLDAVPKSCRVVESNDPVQTRKAVKNATELACQRESTERDCAAYAAFLAWVDEALAHGTVITERSAAARLEALRRNHANYLGGSFETIPAYGPHAALMHYAVTPDSDVAVEARGFLLVDAGSQYLDGTTDLTRTIACGPLSDRQRRDYTLVLKGHIALSRAVFRQGTTGSQLDILARGVLARDGLNYNCGTGHGVGFCLGVHEGPHSISQKENGEALEPGMVVTNEPGVYREGEYGIRIENTLLVVEHATTSDGRFLSFEPLSHCPIDLRPVMPELLTDEEVDWLGRYHAETFRRLAPRVEPATRAWLVQACAPRSRDAWDLRS